MKLGCNWSVELMDLLESGDADIDYIKAGAFGEMRHQIDRMLSVKPVLLHGLGYFERAGMPDISIIDFDKANRLIARCGSPHYGLHLSIKHADMPSEMTEEEIYAHISKQVQIVKKNISVPLLLENVPDTPQERTLYDHVPFVLPEQIGKVLVRNDVGLLLDLTHAKTTALYRNWGVHDYIRALPLHLVREIHVNGSGYDEQGYPIDAHQAMAEEDYGLLDWVLSYARPVVVTLEYIGLESENRETIRLNLANQLRELNRICRSKA